MAETEWRVYIFPWIILQTQIILSNKWKYYYIKPLSEEENRWLYSEFLLMPRKYFLKVKFSEYPKPNWFFHA